LYLEGIREGRKGMNEERKKGRKKGFTEEVR
jgi:hypothetical protein